MSALIDRIYSCGEHPDQWPSLLPAIACHLGVGGVEIIGYHWDVGWGGAIYTLGGDPSTEHPAGLRVGVVALPAGSNIRHRLQVGEMIVERQSNNDDRRVAPRDADRRNIQFFAPGRFGFALCVAVNEQHDGRRESGWGLGIKTHVENQMPSIDTIERMHDLVPHLTRAGRCCEKLSLKEKAHFSQGSFYLPPTRPCMIVSDRGQIVVANRSMEALLQRESALQAEAGQVIIRLASVSRTLSALLAGATLQMTAKGAAHLELNVADLQLGVRLLATGDKALYWLETFESLRGLAGLAVRYRLTAAEVRVLEAIARDESVRHFASARGVSVNTVRFQLKTSMAKLGVHSQRELLRRVLLET